MNKKKLFLACFARIIEKDIYIKIVVLFLIKEKNFCKKNLFHGIDGTGWMILKNFDLIPSHGTDGMGWDCSIVTKFRWKSFITIAMHILFSTQ